MNTIDERLYDELFEKKHVNCQIELYRLLYNLIWPCEDLFKQFLISTDTSVKIKYAKKIFYVFNSRNEILFPDFIINELISVQQYDLKRNTNYIPQDHLIHSINLYVLGIYAFFNIEVFHRKLINETNEKNLLLKTETFVKKWILFSFYHDIGYVIEGNVDQGGNIRNKAVVQKYKDINDALVYKYATQCLAKLITNIYVLRQSKKTFKADKDIVLNYDWIFDNNRITGMELVSKLQLYDDYVLLDGINSEDDYNYVSWLLQDINYLIVYENTTGTQLAYKFVNRNGDIEVAYNNSLICQYSEFFDEIRNLYLSNKHSNIQCKYYANGLKNKISDMLPRKYKNEIWDYYDTCVPNDIKKKISLASNPNYIEYVYTLINQWLCEITVEYDSNKEKIVKSPTESATERALLYFFEKYTSLHLKEILNFGNSTKEKLQRIIEIFEKIPPNEVDKKIREYYNNDNGTIQPILHYFSNLLKSINEELNKDCKYIDITDNIIKLSPFYYNDSNTLAKKIYLNMQEASTRLKIDFNLLKEYSTDYTSCDHGVVSASILFHIFSFNEKMLKLMCKNPLLGLTYHNSSMACQSNEDESIEIYSNVIFSILLHNIYTKSSKEYGINYKQNIDINAFSYFCSLMDALQKWGRTKQLDMSVVDIPKDHFLQHDFDIVFTDYKIKIICSTDISGSMRKEINKLEEYLPGASHIIKLCEREL